MEELEAAEAAERCPRCGLPKAECRNVANQFRWAAGVEQCHAMAAIEAAMAQFGEDANANRLVWSAQLRH